MKSTEQDADMADAQDDYEEKLKFLNAIARPVANKKLAKRLFKCIKKGEKFC
jgi:H/ACA ribonucleoprotein complex subunit 2